ncbi:alkaline phosphatase PhoX [Sphingomonas sp. LHG3406-1]|uniref:alkaline phosphatase PhoX n=1 Tax=Sphingomonas sp. LHG3406-1 TaxID=2804617 RepID=UPI00262FDFC0|nr:alkaline phosphatase PhoX [Sphingomonas sp. LHG3406-1]
MLIDRRGFAGAAAAGLAFGALPARASLLRQEQPQATYRNEAPGFGPLVADPLGYFDLPSGFTYAVLSQAGEAMDDGFIAPDNFDGMACFPAGTGRVALVRNHELKAGAHAAGPAGTSDRLHRRLAASPHFGKGPDGRVLPGGTSTLVVDLKSRRRTRQWLSLAGTAVNCAGGATPWGSWLSCEETTIAAPEVEQSHGWVFEVPAAHRGLVEPVRLTAMGRFRHEAAAVDSATGIVYLTEDKDDGLFYRFIPAKKGRLAEGGRLQALAIADLPGADTRNWSEQRMTVGQPLAVRWIDLAHTHSPDDDLRQRGRAAGAAIFARGEGVEFGKGELYFTCTSGGAKRHGQIMRYRPGPQERLDLFVESGDADVFDYGDNLTIAPWGDLIVCEDRTDGKTNHLRGVAPDGRIYTFARLHADTELAGVCFSPDGSTMFVNAYRPGRTLAITGDWARALA